MTAAAVALTWAALWTGHTIGDHWVQTGRQATTKGLPGWPGRRACAAHVATYTATQAVVLAAALTVTGLPWPSPWALAAGLSLSAVTHYLADRREPLRRLAARLGKADFWDLAPPLGGAYALDQAWHHGWILAAALLIGGAA